jgi:glyoxylase-like metal-dependent hydrolase (beta-lactamase superfamily II)
MAKFRQRIGDIMRRNFLGLLIVAILAAPAIADPFQYARQEITNGVHLIYRIDPVRVPVEGNVIVIEQESGLVVVDSGGSRLAAERIIDQIRHISNAPVRSLVNTHWHGDHHLGNATFLATWPALEIVAHENTIDHISGDAMDYIFESAEQLEAARPVIQSLVATGALPDGTELPDRIVEYYSNLYHDLDILSSAVEAVEIVAPTRGFSDRLVLDDPRRPVELRYFGRGNTDGDAVIWLPAQRIVVSGDLVVHPTPFGFGSYPMEWIETLRDIAALDFAYLIPGHGDVQTDTAYIEQLIALMEASRAQVAPLAESGMSLDAVREQVDLSAFQARFANGDAWIANRFNAWWVQPFVGVVYQEATGDPIVQGQ